MQSQPTTQNQTPQDPTARREGENLVKLSARTNVRAVIRYIVDLFKVKNYDVVHISGLNFAISNVILVTEVVKTQVLGLHQVNNIDCVEMDSRDQSSGEVQVIRRTPKFEVVLSRAEPKAKSFGYQRPLSQDEVQTILSVQGMDSSEGAERGRGGRGRGGRGGYGRGRGRGGRGRGGRGRGGRGGYGSRSGSFDESTGVRGGRGGYERGSRGGYERGGRGGYERRGGERGGYERRGGERGGYERRGGERGGYERRGGERGGRGERGGYERGGRGGYERGGRGGYERGSRGGYERGGRGNFQNSSETTTPQQVNVRTGTVGLKK